MERGLQSCSIAGTETYPQSRLPSRQMSYSTTDLTPPVHVPWMPPDGLDIAAHGRNLLHANSKTQRRKPCRDLAFAGL
jgi:hypothetical protein